MPAYYYIKKDGTNDGTATGDAGRATSKRTGSFATMGTSAYYATHEDAEAATTAPVAGDYFIFSDLHNDANTSATAFTLPDPDGLIYVSVDDANADTYSAGATISTSSGTLDINGCVTMYGMTITTTGGNFQMNADTEWGEFYNCTFNITNTGSRNLLATNSCAMYLHDCSFTFQNVSSGLRVDNGGHIEVYGGTVTNNNNGSVIAGTFGNKGGSAKLVGVDVSSCQTYFIGGAGGGANDGRLDVLLDSCKVHSSMTAKVEETFQHKNQNFRMTRCTDAATGEPYQEYLETFAGTAEDSDDTSIHRDETQAWPDSTKTSTKVVTTSNCSHGSIFTFDLCAEYFELTDTAKDVIEIYFASTSTLTDVDVWAEMIYMDATNKQTPNYVTNKNSNILAAGTEWTDDSGSSTWKNGASDLTGHNEYKMTLDTSTDAGHDGLSVIRIHVAIPSVTIYFDKTVGYS